MKNFHGVIGRITLILCLSYLGHNHFAFSAVKDTELEKRLVVDQEYRVVKGDTLKKIASKVWGHSSWWKRLKKKNIKLASFSANKKIPAGYIISYRAPRVGHKYIVKKNDTLGRIALWKFGKKFRDYYAVNKVLLKTENYLQKGFEVTFRPSGEMKLAKFKELANSVNYEKDVYITNKNDTIKKVAYKLYGRFKYWKEIIRDNPGLKKTSIEEKLPENMTINYWKPIASVSYRVLKGDSLSRIALWAFGKIDKWKEIYELNKDKIDNPNVITPGMLISLKAQGLTEEYKKAHLAKLPKKKVSRPAPEMNLPVKVEKKEVVSIPAAKIKTQLRDVARKTPSEEKMELPTIALYIVAIIVILFLSLFIYSQYKSAGGSYSSNFEEIRKNDKYEKRRPEVDLHFHKDLLKYGELRERKTKSYLDIIGSLRRKIAGRVLKKNKKLNKF